MWAPTNPHTTRPPRGRWPAIPFADERAMSAIDAVLGDVAELPTAA
jgi:hypothetical protein